MPVDRAHSHNPISLVVIHPRCGCYGLVTAVAMVAMVTMVTMVAVSEMPMMVVK